MYVGQNGGDVSVIDTATKEVTTIRSGAPVRDLAITPDGGEGSSGLRGAKWLLTGIPDGV